MTPKRSEGNPGLEIGWHHSCRVSPVSFKNAFSHPFCVLGYEGYSRTCSAMSASASLNCCENQMGPACSLVSPPAQVLFHSLPKKETHLRAFAINPSEALEP